MPCLQLPFERGWGNGYVLIPHNHKLYGKSYDDKDFPALDVHGGVTWAADVLPRDEDVFEFITEKPDSIDGLWVLGFDTAHSFSNSFMDKEWVKRETLRLKEQLEAR